MVIIYKFTCTNTQVEKYDDNHGVDVVSTSDKILL